MGRVLAAVLGLCALAAAAYLATRTPAEPPPGADETSAPAAAEAAAPDDEVRSAPARRLDNVREAKERIEAEQAERLEKVLRDGR